MGNRVPRKSRFQKVSKRAFHRRRSHGGPPESRTTLPVLVIRQMDILMRRARYLGGIAW